MRLWDTYMYVCTWRSKCMTACILLQCTKGSLKEQWTKREPKSVCSLSLSAIVYSAALFHGLKTATQVYCVSAGLKEVSNWEQTCSGHVVQQKKTEKTECIKRHHHRHKLCDKKTAKGLSRHDLSLQTRPQLLLPLISSPCLPYGHHQPATNSERCQYHMTNFKATCRLVGMLPQSQ